MPDSVTHLSKAEMEILQRIAQRDGITAEEAATNLVQSAIARKVKKRTGKAPAKVYQLRGKP